jgi:hypothetical protein
MRSLAIVLALSFALVPAADASGIAYRTTHQAEAYLEHGLKRWAGVNLESRKYRHRVAFCLDGARSKYEKSHRHFRARTSKTGETLYHTFTCKLADADRLWHVYLVARPTGFSVRADR